MSGFDAVKYRNSKRDQTYDRVELIVPIGMKAMMQERAAEIGLYNKANKPNISGYVQKLVEEDLKR